MYLGAPEFYCRIQNWRIMLRASDDRGNYGSQKDRLVHDCLIISENVRWRKLEKRYASQTTRDKNEIPQERLAPSVSPLTWHTFWKSST